MMAAPFPLYTWLLGDLPDVSLLVRLYQSISPGNPFPTPSDFVEAQYPGYAVQPLAAPLPYTPLDDGSFFVSLPGLTWTVTKSDKPGCMANGCYITSLEPGNVVRLVAWVAFDGPQALLQSGDYLIFDFSLSAAQMITPSA